MKTMWKRSVGLVLTVAMMLSLMITGASAAEPEIVYQSYRVKGQQSMLLNEEDAFAGVPLRDGNYENWIDRVILPEYATEFYDVLVEGCDNDGVDDFFIEEELYDLNLIPLYVMEGEVTDEQFNEFTEYVYAAYTAFEHDHPEVFWLDSTVFFYGESFEYSDGSIETWIFIISHLELEDGYVVDLRKEGYRSESAIKTAISQLDAQVDAIVAGAEGSDYDKVRYFNTYLTQNNEYNTVLHEGLAPITAWDAPTALYGNTGAQGPVCEGYSKAMKVLCDRVGIPCVLVDNLGTAADVEDHMWNYIQIDGAWYGVDVTWNDPVVEGHGGACSGYENEDYMLVGANTVIDGEVFRQSHMVGNCPDGVNSFPNGPVLSEEAYVPAAQHIPGDINGDGLVNNRDATRLFQHLAGWNVEVVEDALDVNGDGAVNNRDATRLFQHLAGWNVEIY